MVRDIGIDRVSALPHLVDVLFVKPWLIGFARTKSDSAAGLGRVWVARASVVMLRIRRLSV